MTQILDDGERWVKSGLLGQGIEAHYDIDRMTPYSHGPVIAEVLVSHTTEEARRTASARADLICSIPELLQRAEAAEARAAQAEAERDEAQRVIAMLQGELNKIKTTLAVGRNVGEDKEQAYQDAEEIADAAISKTEATP